MGWVAPQWQQRPQQAVTSKYKTKIHMTVSNTAKADRLLGTTLTIKEFTSVPWGLETSLVLLTPSLPDRSNRVPSYLPRIWTMVGQSQNCQEKQTECVLLRRTQALEFKKQNKENRVQVRVLPVPTSRTHGAPPRPLSPTGQHSPWQSSTFFGQGAKVGKKLFLQSAWSSVCHPAKSALTTCSKPGRRTQ